MEAKLSLILAFSAALLLNPCVGQSAVPQLPDANPNAHVKEPNFYFTWHFSVSGVVGPVYQGVAKDLISGKEIYFQHGVAQGAAYRILGRQIPVFSFCATSNILVVSGTLDENEFEAFNPIRRYYFFDGNEFTLIHEEILLSETNDKIKVHPLPGKTGEREYVNSLGISFVLIPAGDFTMKTIDGLETRVSVKEPFYMSKTEITQSQWERTMGEAHRVSKKGDNLPVDYVSWYEAKEFAEKMSQAEKREGNLKYRLPTEAEWEYAAKAGENAPFSSGYILTDLQANFDGTKPFGTFRRGKKRGSIIPVASFPPNPWGLFDMHGNVDEWCEDYPGVRGTQRNANEPVLPPTIPTVGEFSNMRVVRGGSFFAPGLLCRADFQSSWNALQKSEGIGFRVVLPAR